MKANTPDTPNSLNPGIGRRSLLIAVLGAPALAALVAACGDKTKQSDGTTANSTVSTSNSTTDPTSVTTDPTSVTTDPTAASTPATAAVAAGIEHPVDADEVILRYGLVGGFTTRQYAFIQIPSVLVTGDGRLITPGIMTLEYPGPLLSVLNERSITEEGIQKLLALADSAGLLAPPPDYSAEVLVADAPDTRVEIHADGATYIHQAVTLGFDEPNESDARKALRLFAEQLDDITTAVGDQNLGPDAPLVPAAYRIQTEVVTEAEIAGYEPAPTVLDWTLTDVSLADAADCLAIPLATAGTVFADAKQNSLFRETVGTESLVYRVAVIAKLPGETCG
ncbi:MAG: hypothetical protein ABIR32_08170 [Ilumatobacteraceae bacterium]